MPVVVGHADELLEDLVRQLAVGSEYALAGARLAADLGVTERTIRELVGECIDRGILVGSCANGYFIIRDLKDLEVGTRHLVSRARSLFRRVATLKRAAAETFSSHEVQHLFELEEVASQ
jgi:hypothetical protein